MGQRIALVTGGMGGIGAAICRALHDAGIKTIAGYNRGGNHDSALAWQAQQKSENYCFDIIHTDVTQVESCEAAVKKIEKDIGPIDILVNNAGISRDSTCNKMKLQDWKDVIDTNLNSVFYVTQCVLGEMLKRQHGRIINISSINGQKGQFGQVNYAASKAGMHGFTKALALEVARKGITVNTISPGYVDTNMVKAVPEKIREQIITQIPLGRFALPEEVAHVVVFLADEKSAYITGTNIAINGGQYMV
jgi:acetoacetyl-CoA reductase